MEKGFKISQYLLSLMISMLGLYFIYPTLVSFAFSDLSFMLGAIAYGVVAQGFITLFSYFSTASIITVASLCLSAFYSPLIVFFILGSITGISLGIAAYFVANFLKPLFDWLDSHPVLSLLFFTTVVPVTFIALSTFYIAGVGATFGMLAAPYLFAFITIFAGHALHLSVIESLGLLIIPPITALTTSIISIISTAFMSYQVADIITNNLEMNSKLMPKDAAIELDSKKTSPIACPEKGRFTSFYHGGLSLFSSCLGYEMLTASAPEELMTKKGN